MNVLIYILEYKLEVREALFGKKKHIDAEEPF